MADWQCFARDQLLAQDDELPIVSLQAVTRYLLVSTALLTTPFTPERFVLTGVGRGVIVRRDGVDVLTGPVISQQIDVDEKTGRAAIQLKVLGDETVLDRRIVLPDPTRAGDQQSTVDYWTATGTPSAAMLRLIREQAGPGALPTNRVPGLYMGADPGVGTPQPWSLRYDNVLTALAAMSVRSGANLGVRVGSTPDGLLAQVVAPRDVAADVRFSPEVGNLPGLTYTRTAPTVTTAIAAGGGDLRNRLQQQSVSTDPLDAAWGLPGWAYIDRRDTTDTAELSKSAADAVADGSGTVSASFTVTDTDAVQFGRDWGPYPGDRVTVEVGLPGTGVLATITDVVREIRFEVERDGSESIRPAVGTPDATVGPPSPTREQLAAIGDRLTMLERRK